MIYCKLISVLSIIFILLYKLFFIIEYINQHDSKNIRCSLLNKVVISSINTFLILLIYIKEGISRGFFIFTITFIFLIFIGYIDYETSYVYEVITKPFLIFSVIVFITNIIGGRTGIKEIIYSLICILIMVIMEKTKALGGGDVEVFIGLFLIFSTYYLLPVIIVMMSMGISGMAGVLLLLKGKVDLAYRKPLCPSIAIACYLIILLI